MQNLGRSYSSRREFLRVGSAGLFGLTLADMLRIKSPAAPMRRSQPTAKSVIMIWLSGGPSTIDMWDLKPAAPEEIRGEFDLIKTTVPDLHIGQHMPKLAQVLDRCTLVRSMHHGLAAHGPGTQYVTSGNLPSPAVEYPSLGSLASVLLKPRQGIPAFFTIGNQPGTDAGYLGASHNPFRVQNDGARGRLSATGIALPQGFAKDELANRVKLRRELDRRFADLDDDDILLSGLDTFQQQAVDILRTERIAAALRVQDEPRSAQEWYGSSPLGIHALAARRLIEAGARFVTIGSGNWDTHSGNFTALRNQLLPNLDAALSALIADLEQRGLLQSTLVYCGGEFGRTPQVNRTAGRDHWSQASALLLAGGGVKSGFVYGSTDKFGKAPDASPCSPDDIAATCLHALGFSPDHQLNTVVGRPMPLVRNGNVLHELLANRPT